MLRAEVYQYLSGFSEAVINGVLSQLGYADDCEEFEEDVIEKVESIFNAVGDAHAQLPPSSSGEMQLRGTTAIATVTLGNQGIEIPAETLVCVAKIILKSATQADQLADMAEQVFTSRLQQRQQEFGKKLANALESGLNETTNALDDLKQMINVAYPVNGQEPKINTDGFLAQMQKELLNGKAVLQKQLKSAAVEEERIQQADIQRANNRKVNIQAFLEEYKRDV